MSIKKENTYEELLVKSNLEMLEGIILLLSGFVLMGISVAIQFYYIFITGMGVVLLSMYEIILSDYYKRLARKKAPSHFEITSFDCSNSSVGQYEQQNVQKNNKTKSNNSVNNSLIFPNEYIVLDVETTGLKPEYDYIIELSAIKISNGVLMQKFTSLIRPDIPLFDDEDDNHFFVDDFITDLTGITNDMLLNAPLMRNKIDDFLKFIGDDIIVGHNINFDLNFIYNDLRRFRKKYLTNESRDLMNVCKELFPDFRSYKLQAVAEELNIKVDTAHRALADCITTYRCFEKCREYTIQNHIDLDHIKNSPRKETYKIAPDSHCNFKEIKPQTQTFDTSNPFYGKVCVFSGVLEKLTRAEAAQLIVNAGGVCRTNVSSKTNFLILGSNENCTSIKDINGKSTKQIKAEELMLKGQDIQIMPEDTFYDLIFDYVSDEDKGDKKWSNKGDIK